jgi:class 3 adenylate cyclase
VCAFCGEEAPPDSAFCPNDGRALTAALFPASGAPLTVLFTDIEDSVQLTERYGDSAWVDIVDDHNQIVREGIATFAGFEVKVTGDGFLIVFADPVKAAEAAIDTQRRIAARGVQRPDWPVVVRMGLHRGDVILRPGGDILGRTVNMAQRVMDKSGGGEIWASVSVYEEAVGAIPEEQWLDRGMRRLRGVKGRQHLYELVWPASEASR